MIRQAFRDLFRNIGLMAVIAMLAVSFALSGGVKEKFGDNIQIFLPLGGLACAVAGGEGARYVGRYLLLTAIYTASKHGLGDAAINQRPRGGNQGFPSGHMSAATFGAVGMTQTCLAANKPAQALAIISAGIVGGSRIEAGAHDLWQVTAAAILGWLMQVLALRQFDRGFRAVWQWTGRRISALAAIPGRIRGAPEGRATRGPDGKRAGDDPATPPDSD